MNNQINLSWYEVPQYVKNLLISAADSWDNRIESEKYIYQALEENNGDLNVLVSAYRYFFYKNNNQMALEVANKVINQIKVLENLPDDWEQLKPVLLASRDDANIRLYLNAYTASGLILARLGKTDQALEISTRVKEIDDKKEFGSATVFSILTTPVDDDDD